MDGAKLRELRLKANLAQEKLSEMVGITQRYLSQIELGYKEPNTAILKRLADALNCSADELLGRKLF